MDPLIRHIILATDFSDASEGAVRHAVSLSRALGARLTLLHVFEPSGWMVPSPYYFTPGFEQWVDASLGKTRQAGKDALADLAASLEMETETLFAEGPTGREIVRAAAEHHADLLVLGTHGYTGWNRLTLGSIAEYVVRHAACPVLAVKPERQDAVHT
ncbi:universal stress protein [Nitrosovibrio sp. Nv17]|jgi:nucleotide-binding universal stress UspA family protein|uniref:universal stress protein n=1 Tax=Nitrosovibrio sp. Nv17 TaxID=1855339 RepID=UPI00090861D6|nr:universal stress protein [Nitrosovibrio sp. Nv17]SFW13860.1 Nucleotide-binding universal stress protein, UspA family [Nitrosovibrio sp. Nv17]